MSHLSRSCRIFSSGSWLPLRNPESFKSDFVGQYEPEEIEFLTKDGIKLKGSYFSCDSKKHRGVVLYCHEMNGTRWGIAPFIGKIREAGFDLFTFDQRSHGESDSFDKFHSTPWITTYDLDDVRSAVDCICSRNESSGHGSPEISIFGLGKGATLALCCAGLDKRIQSVIMDCPAQEDRLYEKNCLTTLFKSGTHLFTRRFSLFVTLVFKSILYVLVCPFLSVFSAWRRFMMSLWYGGTFVNTCSIIRKLRKPILIIHGDMETAVSVEQIQSFRHRMPLRTKIWLVKGSSVTDAPDADSQIVSFLLEPGI